MYSIKSNLVLFVIINKDKIFGLMKCIRTFTEVSDIVGGRLITSYKMIDSIIESFDSIPDTNADINTPNEITIIDINRKITKDITLKYNGKIVIDLNKKGIILLDGMKGCGKSVTLDFIAGMYDGNVTNGVFVDGNIQQDEFRSLSNNRIYIRQCIGDDYRMNRKNTITMTLSELFPGGSHETISEFLEIFGVSNKIPQDINTGISDNEKGISPGQIQSIVLASQLWKVFILKVNLLLLDEPERNIDFETVKKIFDMLHEKFEGTIILITHSNELKTYLKENKAIKQSWVYENNTNMLSFTVK